MRTLLIALFFIPWPAVAADYFVKTGGNDGLDGLSDANAWATIGKVNSFTFANGDTVSFNRGDTFDDATIGSPGVDNFTFIAYGSGDNPWINGNVVQPMMIDDTISNLTVSNLDISGQAWSASKAFSMYILNVDGVTIDGVTGDGWRGFTGGGQGKNAIMLDDTTGDTVVRNVVLSNWGPEPFDQTHDIVALGIQNVTAGNTILVEDNDIRNVQSDCFQLYLSNVPATIRNNIFVDGGENAIDNKGSANSTYYGNQLYRTPGFTGVWGQDSDDAPLFTAHATQGRPVSGVKVYSNTIGPSDYSAVQFKGNTDIGDTPGTGSGDGIFDGLDMYDNTINGSRVVLKMLYNVNNLSFRDNTATGATNSFLYETNVGVGSSISNNTFESDEDMALGLDVHISVSDFTGNIIQMTDNDSSLMVRTNAGSSFSYNYWWNSGSASTWIDDRGTLYGSDDEAAWVGAGNIGDKFEYVEPPDPPLPVSNGASFLM